MLEINRGAEFTATDFKSAFQTVCAFLGRPSSQTVLFSGIPEGELDLPDIDAVERLARHVGLSVATASRGDLRGGNVDLPAIAVFADGTALALLERDAGGDMVCGFPGAAEAPTIAAAKLLQHNPVSIFGFSLIYSNTSEDASVGQAPEIERPHWLSSTLTPFWRTYLQIALAAFVINMIALATPLFTMNVYDRVLPNHAIATLWVLVIGVTIALLFDLLLKTARAALIDYAGRKADIRLSYLLFDKVLHSTLASRPFSTGEYASRVSQYEFVREFFTSNTIAVLIDTAFAFVFLLVIYLVAGWIVLVPASAFVVAIVIGVVAHHSIGIRVAAAANEAAQRQALLVETIATLETVKALRAEAPLLRKWHELGKNAARTSERIKEVSATAANATQFVQQLVTIVIVLAGTYSFAAGDISMGAIIASVMLSSRTVGPLGQIAMTLARLKQATLSLRILEKIMEQEEDRPASVGFVNRTVANAGVAFQTVGFTYPGSDQQVLNGLNFAVREGERVGIIGRIGSGKTTIGRLLGGLYPAELGRVLLDGIDVRQYHPAEVRKAVAVAGQAADLFSGTVKENLLIGRPDATDEELLEVSRVTGVDSFVSSHPRGFDMPVGERGSQLSGGQKQALTIARLLLARPRVVYLDEPSGAMDLASERLLIENLKKSFASNVTVIISTHRYSMLELVDRLIVIDQGRVIADGPKQQVIEALRRNSLWSSIVSAAIDKPPLLARLALAFTVLFFASFVAWAAIARVDEIARGNGKVIPVSKTQIIQASEPGVVREIAVKLGQVVKQGDLIVRLDDTTSASSLGESQAKAASLKAKIARLQFEISGGLTGDFACPPDLQSVVPVICENESALFNSRRENFRNKYSVLKAREAQRAQELAEAETNISQLENVIAAMTKEHDTIQPLVEKHLHAETDLLRMETQLAQQNGQLAVARESIGRLKAALDEATLQIDELSLQFQQDAKNDLSQVLGDLGVLDETIRGATDRVNRTDIRSPVDGIVNTLDVNTLGAYVQPGSVIAGVVPTSEKLLVEARISPRDVAFVQRGQPALVKITAYDFSIYGGLKGEVVNVSADSLVDQEHKETYYQVLVRTDVSTLEHNGKKYSIMPGMVASAEIMTGQKTVLDYLLKPINKARSEALTER